MATLLKKGAFAAYMGVVPSAVTAWDKRGLLVYADDPQRPGKKLVDAEKSRVLVNGSLDPMMGRSRTGEAQKADEPETKAGSARAIPLDGLEAARLEDMRERTLGRRRENEKEYGTLVLRIEAERRASDLARLTRERTYGIIRQLSERLAATTEPREVTALLTDAFDKMFSTLADQIEAEAKAEAVADATLAEVEAATDAEAEEGLEDEDEPA